MPLFSLVTATYNAENLLPTLLASLASQTCRDFEVVVQDGASSDGTLALLEAWRDRLPAMSVVSAPDRGIYEAWNRALERINGRWVLFLGADDALAAADVLAKVKGILDALSSQEKEKARFVGGSVLQVANEGGVGNREWHYQLPSLKTIKHGMPFPHPALFHSASLFVKNRFDASLRIAADYDFMCKCWTPQNGSIILPFIVTRMRRGGISDRPDTQLLVRWENLQVASRYFKHVWTPYRVALLAEGVLTVMLYRLFGRRGLVVPNALRKLCGFPPAW